MNWDDWKPIDTRLLGTPPTPEAARRLFWQGFWSAFRHPVLIYGYGFAFGFVVRGLVA